MSVLSKVFAESVLTDAVSCHQDERYDEVAGAGCGGELHSDYHECQCEYDDQRKHNVLLHFFFLLSSMNGCIFKICFYFNGIVISLTSPLQVQYTSIPLLSKTTKNNINCESFS